jgi:hypothetical protein
VSGEKQGQQTETMYLEQRRQLVVSRIRSYRVCESGGVDDRLALCEGELSAVWWSIRGVFLLVPAFGMDDSCCDGLETLTHATETLDEVEVEHLRAWTEPEEFSQSRAKRPA